MAFCIPISHFKSLPSKVDCNIPKSKPVFVFVSTKNPIFRREFIWSRLSFSMKNMADGRTAAAAVIAEKSFPVEEKEFVDQMRFVSMKFHSRDQAKEGERDSDLQPVSQWEPTIEGYLKFLVDSKAIYETLETILKEAPCPWYAEFGTTGLERSENLAKDLEWFKEQGHAVPEPSLCGTSYAYYLQELSDKDPPAFVCHVYNVYLAHTAGGQIIGQKVADKLLGNKKLEFYKWDGNLIQLRQNMKEKISKIAEKWSREEKECCLEETEKCFGYSEEMLRLISS